jgi:hypothetical protein
MAGKGACTELACGLAFASRSVPNYSRRPAGRPFPCASTEISIGDTGVSPLRHCDSPPLSRSTQGMIRARRLMVLRATVVEMRLTPCICAISPRSRASRVPTSAMRRAEDNRPSRGRIALENRRMAHYGLLELRVQVRLDGQRRFDLCPIACDAFLLLQAADAAWSRRFAVSSGPRLGRGFTARHFSGLPLDRTKRYFRTCWQVKKADILWKDRMK